MYAAHARTPLLQARESPRARGVGLGSAPPPRDLSTRKAAPLAGRFLVMAPGAGLGVVGLAGFRRTLIYSVRPAICGVPRETRGRYFCVLYLCTW